MEKYCIGYLDDEDGFKIDFYQKYNNEFDLKMLDINDIQNPSDIIIEIEKNNLELLVLDYMLNTKGKHFNADEILNNIRKWNKYFPVLILTAHEINALSQLDEVNIINRKDDLTITSEGKNLFALKIEENIKNLNHKKNNAIHVLEELLEKKEKIGLTQDDEELYYRLYNFLIECSPKEKIIPSHLLNPQSINSLDNLLRKTDEILNFLKEKK